MLKLDRERRTYEAALPELLKGGEGQFVVILGDDVRKVMPTYEEALKWGYQNIGLGGFFVRQITAVERTLYFSRFAVPCAD